MKQEDEIEKLLVKTNLSWQMQMLLLSEGLTVLCDLAPI